ncbi:uncharacterized protein SCHCODRAFT_02713867 [Schizophyllum commune H4-8]|nr:uncharacterized protein SCHCODRAFT_02713867 [Schizophyllum commune H4-8]KAI5887802.1 hypothetical protein SCHCODRAFT_02713867 [Schizophyllum commune H4-8]
MRSQPPTACPGEGLGAGKVESWLGRLCSLPIRPTQLFPPAILPMVVFPLCGNCSTALSCRPPAVANCALATRASKCTVLINPIAEAVPPARMCRPRVREMVLGSDSFPVLVALSANASRAVLLAEGAASTRAPARPISTSTTVGAGPCEERCRCCDCVAPSVFGLALADRAERVGIRAAGMLSDTGSSSGEDNRSGKVRGSPDAVSASPDDPPVPAPGQLVWARARDRAWRDIAWASVQPRTSSSEPARVFPECGTPPSLRLRGLDKPYRGLIAAGVNVEADSLLRARDAPLQRLVRRTVRDVSESMRLARRAMLRMAMARRMADEHGRLEFSALAPPIREPPRSVLSGRHPAFTHIIGAARRCSSARSTSLSAGVEPLEGGQRRWKRAPAMNSARVVGQGLAASLELTNRARRVQVRAVAMSRDSGQWDRGDEVCGVRALLRSC